MKVFDWVHGARCNVCIFEICSHAPFAITSILFQFYCRSFNGRQRCARWCKQLKLMVFVPMSLGHRRDTYRLTFLTSKNSRRTISAHTNVSSSHSPIVFISDADLVYLRFPIENSCGIWHRNIYFSFLLFDLQVRNMQWANWFQHICARFVAAPGSFRSSHNAPALAYMCFVCFILIVNENEKKSECKIEFRFPKISRISELCDTRQMGNSPNMLPADTMPQWSERKMCAKWVLDVRMESTQTYETQVIPHQDQSDCRPFSRELFDQSSFESNSKSYYVHDSLVLIVSHFPTTNWCPHLTYRLSSCWFSIDQTE